ncbi:YD repeat-containing protein [Luteibacter sp. PvP120]
MVAVIAGNGLGLDNAALGQLGQVQSGQATVGQAGVGQYVNIATGNLVLQGRDEGIVFDGTQLDILRTYNSQGKMAGTHGWSYGPSRSIGGLTGTVNTAGSTVTRTQDDGSTVLYAYDTVRGVYVSQNDEGTEDNLAWTAAKSTWQWTDGQSRQTETYNSTGKITALSNPETGASFAFTYTSNRLTSIKAANGDLLTLAYNASGQLTSVSLKEVPPGATAAITRQQAVYAYDASGRLASVTTTLASDTATSTLKYVTRYTYDGTSDRIASMVQGDGTTVGYTYVADGNGTYRVSQIVMGTGSDAQTMDFGYTATATTVTDALGHAWTYEHDTAGNLTAVATPGAAGQVDRQSYAYDAHGNLASATDALGNVTRYTYDTHGNLLTVVDALGDTVRYTYTSHNQVASRTTYATPASNGSEPTAASDPSTAYFLYDSTDRLAMSLDAVGNVTEYQYAASTFGTTILASSLQHRGAVYPSDGNNTPEYPPTIDSVQHWLNDPGIQALLPQAVRVDFSYDVRGQVSGQTHWDTLDATGKGVTTAGTATTTTTYDAHGRLLQTATVRPAGNEITSYAYDGLGRLVSATDAVGNLTSYVYLDNNNTVQVTRADGLVTTQVRNSAGLLISSIESPTGQSILTTRTLYDVTGHAVATVDDKGVATFTFYDAAGNVTASVASTRKLTAYTYDAQGNRVRTTSYGTAVNTTGWIVNGALTSAFPGAAPTPATATSDRSSWSVRDALGHVVATIDTAGKVVTSSYDSVGNQTSTLAYTTALTTDQMASLGTNPSLTDITSKVTASSTDKTSLFVYDGGTTMLATIDSTGKVTLNTYDAQKHLVAATVVTKLLTAAQLQGLGASPKLADVLAVVTRGSSDKTSLWIYDPAGRLVATVDVNRKVALMTYDAIGSQSGSTAVTTALTAAQLTTLMTTPTLVTLQAMMVTGDTGTTDRILFDAAGRPAGTVTGGIATIDSYDAAGFVTAHTVYSPQLTSAQTAQLDANPTLATLQSITGSMGWTRSINVYDSAHRVVGSVDGSGHIVLTNYDSAGHLASTVAYYTTAVGLAGIGTAPTLSSLKSTVRASVYDSYTLNGYDAQGNLAVSVDHGGYVVAYAYDANGVQIGTNHYNQIIPSSKLPDLFGTPTVAQLLAATKASGFDSITLSIPTGDPNVTVDITPQYGYDASTGSYGYGGAVTVTTTDPGTHVTVAAVYNLGVTHGQLQSLFNQPSYATLKSVLGSATAQVSAITIGDDLGRPLARVNDYDAEIYTYGGDGSVLSDRVYSNISYNTFQQVVADPRMATLLPMLPGGYYNQYAYQVVSADGRRSVSVDQGGSVHVQTTDATGRVVATIDYDSLLSRADFDQLGMTPSLADIDGLIASHASAHNRISVYANDGTLYATVEDGVATAMQRDTAGQVVRSTRFAVALTTAQIYRLASSPDTGTLSGMLQATVADNVTLVVRDSDERPVLSIGSEGNVTSITYDAAGRVLSTTDFANHLSAADRAELGSQPSAAAIVARIGHSDADAIALNFYDANGRLVATVDATHRVTTIQYDANGRRIASTAHDKLLTALQVRELAYAPSLDAVMADLRRLAGNVLTQTLHDAAGRPSATIDATGKVVTMSYDARGNLTATTRYATALSTDHGFIPSMEALYAELHSADGDVTTLTVYDDGNRPTATVDGTGHIAVMTYDAEGNLLNNAVYSTVLTPAQVASLGRTPSLAQLTQLVVGQSTRVIYDDAGQPIVTVDGTGAATFLFYDAAGRLSGTIAPGGAVTAYTYDADGHRIAQTQYATLVSTAGWMQSGYPTTQRPIALPVPGADDADRRTDTLYDAAGRVFATIDAVGMVTLLDLDGEGRTTRSTSFATPVTGAARIAATSATDADGLRALLPTTPVDRVSLNVYDASGRAVASVDSNGTMVLRTFDAQGNLTASRTGIVSLDPAALGALGKAPTYATVQSDFNASWDDVPWQGYYDGQGRIVASVDGEGEVTTWLYDDAHHTVTQTQHATRLTDRTAFYHDRAATEVASLAADPADRSTITVYDGMGRIVSVTDPSGAVTTHRYDAEGRETQWQLSGGGTFGGAHGYDIYGDVTSTTDGNGEVTRFSYDGAGRVTSRTDSNGSTTWYYYDAAGNLSAQIEGTPDAAGTLNARGELTTYAHDAFGQVVSTTTVASFLPLHLASNAVGEGFDAARASLSDVLSAAAVAPSPLTGANRTTRVTYDSNGHVTSRTDGSGVVTRYAYDAFGGLVRSVRGGGDADQVTTYLRDNSGAVISTTEAAGTAQARTRSVTYDAFGRVATSTDATGHVVTHTYDRVGRQVSVSDVVENGASSRTTSTVYDAFGRVITSTDALGHATTYAYDTATRASTVTTPEGVSMTSVADAMGHVVSVTDGAGAVTRYTYDGEGRLVHTVDPLGNVEDTTYTVGGLSVLHKGPGGTTQVTYDVDGRVLSRVTDVGGLALTTSYRYDAMGRTLSVTDPAGSVTLYSYDVEGHVLSELRDAGGVNLSTSYTYDAHGNVLTATIGGGDAKSVTRYQYDVLDRLIAKTVDPDGLNLTSRYVYDAHDRLIASTDPQANTTYWSYDDAGRLSFVFMPAGPDGAGMATLTRFLYDGLDRLTLTRHYVTLTRTDLVASYVAQGKDIPDSVASDVDSQVWSSGDAAAYSVYDADGRLAFSVAQDGHTTEYRYDALGRQVVVLEYANNVRSNAWFGMASEIVSGKGAKAALVDELVSAGNLDGNARVTRTVYDADGRPIYTLKRSMVDGTEEAMITQTNYGADGRISATVRYATAIPMNVLGDDVTAASIATALSAHEAAADVLTTRFVYDGAGRTTAQIDPDGVASFTFYDRHGDVVATVDRAGTAVRYLRDGLGRVLTTRTGSRTVDTSTWLATDGSLTSAYSQFNVVSTEYSDHGVVNTYDAMGRLSTVQHMSGSFSSDSAGDVATYAYDAASRLVSVSDVDNSHTEATRVTRYFYDADGRQTGSLDAAGYLMTYAYDAAGNRVRTTVYAEAVLASHRNAASLADLTPASTASDRITRTFYDYRNLVIGTVDAAGYYEAFERDVRGDVTRHTQWDAPVDADSRDDLHAIAVNFAVRGVRGWSNSIDRDAFGRVVATTNLEGTTNRYAYDESGNLISTTLAAGTDDARTTTSTYDALGRLTSQTDALGATTRFTYDAMGRLARTESPEGHLSWTIYDAAGRILYLVRGQAGADGTPNTAGELVARHYDAFGQLTDEVRYADTIVVDPQNPPTRASIEHALPSWNSATGDQAGYTSYNYDAEGNLTYSSDGSFGTSYQYNAFNEMSQTSHTEYDSAVTYYQHDAVGHVVNVIEAQPNGSGSGDWGNAGGGSVYGDILREQYWTFDAFGQVATQTDGNGVVTQYAFDARGEELTRSRTVDGQVRVTGKTYDSRGRVVVTTDALGLQTHYEYDDYHRTMAVTAPGGLTTTIAHNREGQTIALTDPAGRSTQYGYDADGHLTSTTTADGVDTRSYDSEGNLSLTVDASGRRIAYTYDAAGRVLTQVVDPQGLALTTSTHYSARGLAISVTDPAGRVTHYQHDSAGRMTRMAVASASDPSSDVLDETYSYNYLGKLASEERETRQGAFSSSKTYDGLGRMVQDSPMEGPTVENAYDANGNLISTRVGDQQTVNFYNEANELIASVEKVGQVSDGTAVAGYAQPTGGRVTVYTRDADGRLLAATVRGSLLDSGSLDQLGYSSLGDTPASRSARLAALSAPGPADRTTYSAYNAAGRLALTITPAGTVTDYTYDADGNVIKQFVNARPSAFAPNQFAAIAAGQADPDTILYWVYVVQDAHLSHGDVRVFDDAGRLRVDYQGVGRYQDSATSVHEYRYDGSGNVIADIVYPGTTTVTTDYATAMSSLGARTDGLSTRTIYDGAGRAVYIISPTGLVTAHGFDSDGRQTSTVSFAHPIALDGEPDLQAVANAVAAANPLATDRRTTTTVYDELNRVVAVYDDASATPADQYTYDAMGHKASHTDRAGQIWSYTYDYSGHLSSETGPQATATFVDGTGRLTTKTGPVVKQYSYSANGFLLSQTTGGDGSPQRYVGYTRDLEGNLIGTYQGVANTGDIAVGDVAYTGAPSSTAAQLDVFGNAVVTRNGAGLLSYAVYDADDRPIYQVDPDGYVTRYTYDSQGRQTELRRYAQRIDLGQLAGWSSGTPVTRAQVESILVGSAQDRLIATTFDAAGRKVRVEQSDGNGYGSNDEVTTFTYDGFNHLTTQSVVVGGGRTAVTSMFYDADGRKTIQMDPEAYATTWTYDGFGEVVSTTEWATAQAWDPSMGRPDPSGFVSSQQDRISLTQYDAAGRKTADSISRTYVDASGTTVHGLVETDYGYDLLGRVTTMTSQGRTIATTYDAYGRTLSITAPEQRVLVDNWKDLLATDGTLTLASDALYRSASQVVSYGYDWLGYATVETHGATGTAAGVSTVRRYDYAGNVIASVVQAAGAKPSFEGNPNATFNTYDTSGRLTETLSYLDQEGGTPSEVRTRYAYDDAGRLVSTIVSRGGVVEHAKVDVYDGFGEVIASGDGVSVTVQSTYDNAGRLLTTTDPKTGAVTSYTYDLAGHRVSSRSLVTGGGDAAVTSIAYDLDGNVVNRTMRRASDNAVVSSVTASYDRWGNVLSSTDARGATTGYTYDERNQWLSRTGPAVAVVDAHGVSTWTTTTSTNGYDANGALVRSTDENGNVTLTLRDAAGAVVGMVDGAGVRVWTGYDALGNDVAEQSGSGHLTFKDLDTQGHVIREGDFGDDTGSTRVATWRQVYVVDQAGNRLTTYDGLGAAYLQAGDTANAVLHANFYGYDSQGHVVWSQSGVQRAATLANQNAAPAPTIAQPRNLDFEQGGLAWFSEADATAGWTYANGTAVYNGTSRDTSILVNQDRVPVTPGKQISAWADVESVGNHGGAAVDLRWFDANDNPIGDSGGNIQTVDEGRGISRVTGTAPAGAAYARMGVSATNYSDPDRHITVYGTGWDYSPPVDQLSPGLTNSIFVDLSKDSFSLQPLNPGFENGDSGWDKTEGWSIIQSSNADGGKWEAVYKGTTPRTMTNQNHAPVVPGQSITAKASIALDKPSGSSPAGAVLLLWFDANHNLIGYDSSDAITKGDQGRYAVVSVTAVAPNGAAYATVGLSGNGDGDGAAVFDSVEWDYKYIPVAQSGGYINRFTYDRDGNLVAQIDADGNMQSWTRDAQGRVVQHTDMSGATYQYTYDGSSGLLVSESDDWASKALAGTTRPGYVTTPVGTGNTTTYSYNEAGQVTLIAHGDGSSYSYTYDANGNQIEQRASTVDGNGAAVQTLTRTTYDSHNRIVEVDTDDGTASMKETFAYDAVGNRRNISALVIRQGVSTDNGTVWYDYDGDNRVTVSAGQLKDGTIVVASTDTSYALGYDADGNAATRLTMDRYGTLRIQQSVYDGRHQLVRADYAKVVGGTDQGVAETRTYDAAGHVVTDNQYYALGTTANKRYNAKTDPDSPYYIGNGAGSTPGNDIGGRLSTATITRYDTYGRLAEEQTFGHDTYWDGTNGATTPGAVPDANATSYAGMTLQNAVLYQGTGGSAAYDAMGNVVFYRYQNSANRIDQYTVTYLKKDDYLESATSGQNISNTPNVRPATDESYYNVRGERVAIAQHTQYAGGTVADTVRVFAYDGNGQIVSRRDGTASGDTIDQGTGTAAAQRNNHFVYVNGQQVGHYDNDKSLDVLSQVTAFSSGNSTGDYVVQEGDTLKSIAQAVYGNASLWYVIAQANALGGDNELATGLSLTIPAVTTNQNDATTFKPYNPSEIQGSTTPNLPVIAPPPPPPKQHCNVVATIIVIAVVVAASFVVGPLAAAALNSTLAGVAVGAAAGSAAGQLAGDALGTHQGFSLGEVFTAAATAVVTTGVGQYLSTTSEAASAAQAGESVSTATATAGTLSFAGRAIQAAAGYVAQDVAGKLVGQHEHFSWAGLVSSSLAAGVGGEFGPTPSQIQTGLVNGSDLQIGAGTLVAGVVQRETSRALGDDHVPSLKNIEEQIVGNYVGAALGSRFGGGSEATFDQDALEQRVNGGIAMEEARLGDDIEGSTGASLRGYFAATNGQAASTLDTALSQIGLTPSVGVPGTNFGVSSGSVYLGADVSRPDTSLNRYLVAPDSQEYWGGNGHATAGDFYAVKGSALPDPEKPSNRIDFSKFPVDNRPVARSLPPITGVTSIMPDIGEPDTTFQIDGPSFDTSFVTHAPDLTSVDSTSPEYNAFLGGAARAAGSLAGIGESIYDVARGLTNVGGLLGSAYVERIAGRGGVSDALFNVHTDAFDGAADRLGSGLVQLGSAAAAFARHPVDQTANYVGRLKGDLDHAAALSDSTRYADQFDSGRAFGKLAGEVAMDIDGGTALAKAGIGVSRVAGSFTADALSTMTYSRSTGVTFEAGSGRFALRSPFYPLEGFTPTSLNTPVVLPVGVRSPVVRLAEDIVPVNLTDIATQPTGPVTTAVGSLRSLGLKDAHHVIQDAAVRDLPGYNTRLAPGVQLEGPSTLEGSQHYNATQAQRVIGGGTYGAERQIAYTALIDAGYTDAMANQALREADLYFKSIGVTTETPTRIPGNRR